MHQRRNAEDALQDEADSEEDEDFRPKIAKDRPQVYGAIPGVEIGTHWMYRMEANRVGVHRPVVAGIHPGPKGAYSIALSGGYEDDLDYGECFTYTGEGGRDLKGTKANPKNLRTAPQSKHQSLSRGNKALLDSAESGLPVRVLRGYKLDSPFAPEDGYRYDGLYKVDKWWYTGGLAGFSVYKFALSRLKDQPPPPWYMNTETGDVTMSNENLVVMDSRRREGEEKKDGQAIKIREEADTDLMKEIRNTDDDSHGNKDSSKVVMSGSASEDNMTDAKEEDLEKNKISSENCDITLSEEFANNTSKNPEEINSKNENSCEHDISKRPCLSSIQNESNENYTSRGCIKPDTNDENSEENGDKSSDGEKSSTDGRDEARSKITCDVDSTEKGIKSNSHSHIPNSAGCGDKVHDERKSETATSILLESNSKHLPRDLLNSSVDKNAESCHTTLVVCDGVPSDDTISQDSGLGVTQPQTISDTDVGSMKSGDTFAVIPGKLEVEDENRNITTC